MKNLIGEGSTARVYAISINGKQFALKCYYKEVARKVIKREIQMMSNLHHPNLVRMIDYEVSERWIMMELLSTRDLMDFANLHVRLSSGLVANIFKQLVAVVNYLHTESVAHRDIKLENIYISPGTCQVKLGDLGQAVLMGEGLVSRKRGTIGYEAPELQLNDPTICSWELKQADIFSLGVVLFKLTYNCEPFSSFESRRWIKMREGKWTQVWRYFNKFNPDVPQQVKSVLQGMLEVDPQKRITMNQLMQSELFNQVTNVQDCVAEMVKLEHTQQNQN